MENALERLSPDPRKGNKSQLEHEILSLAEGPSPASPSSERSVPSVSTGSISPVPPMAPLTDGYLSAT